MKTFLKLAVPSIILCMIINAAIHTWENLPHIYKEDYALIYENELRDMFGPDCEIGEKRTVTIEVEDCGCGYHSDGYIYDEWTLTYKDQEGYTHTQIMNNMTEPKYQQLSWLKYQLASYYKQKYMLAPFPEGTFQDLSVEDYMGKSYCFAFIGYPVGGVTMDEKEEYDRTKAAADQYMNRLRESLLDEQNRITFYNLDYTTVFNTYPVNISMDFSIDDADLQGMKKEAHEKQILNKISEIMENFRKDTAYTGNLAVSVSSNNGSCELYNGKKSQSYYILRGEWFQPEESNREYEWQLYFSYEDIFW